MPPVIKVKTLWWSEQTQVYTHKTLKLRRVIYVNSRVLFCSRGDRKIRLLCPPADTSIKYSTWIKSVFIITRRRDFWSYNISLLCEDRSVVCVCVCVCTVFSLHIQKMCWILIKALPSAGLLFSVCLHTSKKALREKPFSPDLKLLNVNCDAGTCETYSYCHD